MPKPTMDLTDGRSLLGRALAGIGADLDAAAILRRKDHDAAEREIRRLAGDLMAELIRLGMHPLLAADWATGFAARLYADWLLRNAGPAGSA